MKLIDCTKPIADQQPGKGGRRDLPHVRLIAERCKALGVNPDDIAAGFDVPSVDQISKEDCNFALQAIADLSEVRS